MLLELVFKAGFSAGLLSLLLFALGHGGALSPLYLAGSVIAALAFFLYISRNDISRRSAVPPFSRAEILLAVVAVLSAAAIVPLAVLPPTVRDELIHHLALPKLYLEHGSIYQIPFMGFSYLSQGIDLLYIIPLAFGSDTGARLVHLAFAVLTGLVVYGMLKAHTGRPFAILGFISYITLPVVFNLARTAYVDHGSAFFSALLLAALMRIKEDGPGFKWLLYASIAAGFAVSAKYNNLILCLAGAFVIAHAHAKKEGTVSAVKAALIFSAFAFLVFSPWAIRNYLWGVGPFYPVLDAAAFASQSSGGVHVAGDLGPVAKRYLLYNESTFEILFIPLRVFWEGADNSIQRFDGVLNPLILLLMPLAFIRRPRPLWLLFAAAFFFIAASFTVDLVARYLLPAMPAVIVLSITGLYRFSRYGNIIKMASILTAVALLAFNAAYIYGLYGRLKPLDYLAGRLDRDGYLSAMLPDYKVVRFANGNLPKDAKVLMLFAGERAYYWDRELIYFDRNGYNLKKMIVEAPDASSLVERLSDIGVTHIFMHERLMERFLNDNLDERSLRVVAEFFNRKARRLFGENGFVLYETI